MTDLMRGYRMRFTPTLKQRRYLARAFGVHRFVWNWALATRKDAWHERQESIRYGELSKRLTALKAEKPWLAEVTRDVKEQALRDLETAYRNFFAKRARFPKFKKRHGSQAVRFQLDSRATARQAAWASRELRLPGLGTCRLIDSFVEWPPMPAMVTVSRDAVGHYWVSFNTTDEPRAAAPDQAIGVDAGITDLAVTSDGWKSGQLAGLREKAARLRRYQRRVSRRTKGSRRRREAKQRLARLHQRIANARKDFTHKVSAKLTASANVIVLETLNVKGMLRNHSLARALSDAAMSELHRQIEYKAARRGSTVIRVGQFEPTSKVCSGCGHHAGSCASKDARHCYGYLLPCHDARRLGSWTLHGRSGVDDDE